MLRGFAVPLDSVLGIARVESVDNARFQHNKVWAVHVEDMRCALRLPNPLEAPLVDVPKGNVSASLDVHMVFARIVGCVVTFFQYIVFVVSCFVFSTQIMPRCTAPVPAPAV
jgi:hypothetical protein